MTDAGSGERSSAGDRDAPVVQDVPAERGRGTSPPDATLDSASASGPSRCTKTGPALCDGFESGGFDPAVWTTPVVNGIKVESARFARGKYALHVHAPNTVGDTYLVMRKALSLAAYPFGRVFVYIDRTIPTRHFFAWTMMEPPMNTVGFTLNVVTEPIGPVFMPTYWRTDPPGGYPLYILQNEKTPPVSKWSCWEWEFNSPVNEVRLWCDGVLVNPAEKYPTFSDWTIPMGPIFKVGWGSSHEEPTYPKGFDIWYDEIAFDRARIGCE